jgi:hypothetical protein
MNDREEQVIAQALGLPKIARAALLARLLDTFDTEVDPDAEQTRDEELGNRLNEIDSGLVMLVPWSRPIG